MLKSKTNLPSLKMMCLLAARLTVIIDHSGVSYNSLVISKEAVLYHQTERSPVSYSEASDSKTYKCKIS